MKKRKALVGFILVFSLCLGNTGVAMADEQVSEIEAYAHFEDEGITSLGLPDTVKSIGTSAYEGSTLTEVTLPEGVVSIGNRSFAKITKITEVCLPESLISIGNAAFYACQALESIRIPQGVTQVENNTFYQCRSLSSVSLPDGITRIGQQAFYACESLREITLPSALKTLEDGAFYSSSLSSVTIPEGTESIGKNCFKECYELTSVTIPASVTIIGEDAFWGCSSLTIYCTAGSAAEVYASEHGIPCIVQEASAPAPSAAGAASEKNSEKTQGTAAQPKTAGESQSQTGTTGERMKDSSPKAGVRLPYKAAAFCFLGSAFGLGCVILLRNRLKS